MEGFLLKARAEYGFNDVEGEMAAKSLEEQVAALQAMEEIRKMHHDYVACLDNMKFDKALGYFIDEATAELCDSGVRRGIAAVTELYREMEVERDGVRDGHFVGESNIVVDGDRATGTWTVLILFFRPSVQWVRGHQECSYVRIDGSWKFSTLKFQRISASDPALLF